MDEIKCITNGEHKYGLWGFDSKKNMAVRSCKCCGINSYYIDTKYIDEQRKKQDEAILLLNDFIFLEVDDINLIGHLYKMVEDVVDYIDDFNTRLLLQKMYELSLNSYLSEENKNMINNFIQSKISNDNDLFFDTYEKFIEYNKDDILAFLSNKRNISR